ncbi:MAG: hypothetical protein QXY62_03745 [Candidatus Altiarchaeota archaeon]
MKNRINLKIKNLIMRERRVKRGIFFTLAIAFLVIPLLLLVSFYMNQSKTEITDESEKIRCEELHYWIEDVKRDLQRAVVIFGRRAAIYAIGQVVEKGQGFENYKFNCNKMCGVNCENFIYTENGSEAAISELVLCGTLYGENVTYMVNHTLREWIERILLHGRRMHFLTNMSLKEIKVIPKDAWNFAIIIENEISSKDERGMCFYRETPTSVISITPIIGLEDPLYPLNTNAQIIKYIYNCSMTINLNRVIGNGTNGNGTSTGTAVLYSNLGGENLYDKVCGVPNKENKIIVFDQAYGLINNPTIKECLDKFAGVIDYQDVGGDPNITSTYVYGTHDLNLTEGVCIWIRNSPSKHTVLRGISLEELNVSSCYGISDIDTYGLNCSERYPPGGSFFDRLDGNYFLGSKYLNQSKQFFNETRIGIESIVDIYELISHEISINENASWVDYLYWQNIYGEEIQGICNTFGYKFRLDCQHMEKYNITEQTSTTTSTTTTTTITTSITTTTITTTTTTISTTTIQTTTIATTTTTMVACSTYDTCVNCINNNCVWNIKVIHIPPPEGPDIIEWCDESCSGLATWCAPPNSCGGFTTTTTTTMTTTTTTISTTTTTLVCYDSDGGQNYYTYGYVLRYGLYYYDYCITSSRLREYYCSGNNVYSTTYYCGYNQCIDGRCI